MRGSRSNTTSRRRTRSIDVKKSIRHAAPELRYAFQEVRSEPRREFRQCELRASVNEFRRPILVRFDGESRGLFRGEPAGGLVLEREDALGDLRARGEDRRAGDILAEEGTEVLDELVGRVGPDGGVGGGADVDEGGDGLGGASLKIDVLLALQMEHRSAICNPRGRGEKGEGDKP